MNDLFMGVSREIISPKVGALLYGYVPDLHSTKVADDLTATAFYFKQGDKSALMISLAVWQINTDLSDEIRKFTLIPGQMLQEPKGGAILTESIAAKFSFPE